MKGTRHSEEQIITILKQGEAGLATAELCRQHGITEQTYYRWKAKYGGMDSGEAKRLKQLEDENRKLKHVVADLTKRAELRLKLPGGSNASKHDFEDGDDVSGSFIAIGPNIKRDVRLMGFTVSVFDIAPTILKLYGIPQPTGMKGHVLSEIFEVPAPQAAERNAK